MPVQSSAKRHAAQVARLLAKAYPDAHCELDFSNPLQLLVATILSAQCTDKRVNIVTPALFKKYRKAADFAEARREALEQDIKTTGFFRAKAKNIQGACSKIASDYNGKVPEELDQLVELPGVGRKTANVVLGVAFGKPTGVVVDTHVTRLSNRLGLTTSSDAVKIERDLMELLPKKEWIDFSHRMIWHGRRICAARKPKCEECSLNKICPRVGLAKSV
jgi:endonuclease-3